MRVQELDFLNFTSANKMISDFLKSGKKISEKELLILLNLKEKELISSFLEGYTFFTDSELKVIQTFINQNLSISNGDFLSDLIDFSSQWNLDISYSKLIEFLSNDEEEWHFVVLSTVNYLTENIKLNYISELVKSMEGILENPNYYQNTQILASLFLFRLTHKEEYLENIKPWFIQDENNILFLKNKLKCDYYNDKYFEKSLTEYFLGENVRD